MYVRKKEKGRERGTIRMLKIYVVVVVVVVLAVVE